MLGAIAGDIIGSIYECTSIRTKDFELFSPKRYFTDDTVLTVAIADAILNQCSYTDKLKEYCRAYPERGYGSSFFNWTHSEATEPYNSYGNGSAMRVSPVAYAFPTLELVLAEAEKTAIVTHNHPEGVKGASAIASAIFLAKTGKTKPEIRNYIETSFNYDLSGDLEDIAPSNVTCQGSVPQAIIAFLQAQDFEDTIRNAVYIGGDTDTIACMAGSIAEAFFGIPPVIGDMALNHLDSHLITVIEGFIAKYNPR